MQTMNAVDLDEELVNRLTRSISVYNPFLDYMR